MKKYSLLIILSLAILQTSLGQVSGTTVSSTTGGYYTAASINHTLYTGTTGAPTNRLHILATNGNIGIGNTTGAERLHVTGSTRADKFNSTTGVFSTIGATNLTFSTNSLSTDGSGGTTWATILNSNGYFGINTAAASIFERFHVTGSIRSDRFNSTTGTFSTVGATNLTFYTNALTTNGTGGSLAATILNSNGYMGIGSTATTPQAKLHVDITSTNATYSSLTGADMGLYLKNTSATTNNFNAINFSDANGTNVAQFGTVYKDHTNHVGSLFFATRASGGSLTQQMTINEAGSVGIGTTTPGSRLDVSGSTLNRITASVTADVKNGFQVKKTGTNATDWEVYNPASSTDLKISNAGFGDLMTFKSNGAIGIGTPLTNNTNGYKLAVKGKIGAHDFQVERISNAWSDYVFEPNYQLLSLSEVEKFIKENGHLEGVPSAKEVETDGYAVSSMDATLLKKIEELTLYIIAQQKEIDALKKEVAKMK